MRPLILFFWHKSMLPSVSSCTMLVRGKVRYIWTLLEPTTSESTARQLLLFFVVSFSHSFTDHTNQANKFKCSLPKVWYFMHLQCIWSESLKLFYQHAHHQRTKSLKQFLNKLSPEQASHCAHDINYLRSIRLTITTISQFQCVG